MNAPSTRRLRTLSLVLAAALSAVAAPASAITPAAVALHVVAPQLQAATGVGGTTPVANADTSRASSAPSAEAPTLSLAQVVQRARANPPAVLQAIANANAADAQVAQVHALLMPTVSAQVSTSGSLNFGLSSANQGLSSQSLGTGADASISVRWTLWDFGRNSLQLQAAQANARAARSDVHSAERNAVAQATAGYYVVLADGELVSSLRATERQRAAELEITRGLVAAGGRAPIEQTRAELSLAGARLDVSAAENTLRADSATLTTALGMDPAHPVSVAPPDRVLSVDDTPEHAADVAEQTRPELASARDRLAAAQSQLAVAGAAYRPTLFATASGGVGASAYDNGNAGTRETASVGVGLSIPIFDPTIANNQRAAEASVASARAALSGQTLAVRNDAVQAALGVRAARQTLAQAEQLAALARANLEQAQGRYTAGAAPLLELVDAQSADASGRIAVIRARFQLELAQVRLLASQGRIADLGGSL